jgi:hypothetical protein
MVQSSWRGNMMETCQIAPVFDQIDYRHEDFQSSCRSGTMCHHRSLLVSIQALNAGLSRSILPIRTHSGI